MQDPITQDKEPLSGESAAVSRLLIDAREAKGLSQKDVADQLYLTVAFIRYIDEGAFHKIPKPAFIKGYLRSYARVVGLDGDVVIEAYQQEQSVMPQAPQLGNLVGEPVGTGSITGPVVQTGVVGLIAIIIVAALVWWLGTGDVPPPVVKQPAVTSAPAVRTDSSTPGLGEDRQSRATQQPEEPEELKELEGMPKIQNVQNVQSGDEFPAADATGPGATSVAALPASSNQAASEIASTPEVGEPSSAADGVQPITQITIDAGVEIERVRDGETQYITVYGGGNEKMEFNFANECWVQIKDADGDMIYRDLNRGGDVMTVYGSAPFEVLLGKATAVRMTYQGKAVELARLMTSDQTAIVRTARL